MMNPIYVEDAVQLVWHERDAVLKRLKQIAVALGHPRWTAKQAAALIREQAELERKLTAPVGQG
jgi:hypothetical protein